MTINSTRIDHCETLCKRKNIFQTYFRLRGKQTTKRKWQDNYNFTMSFGQCQIYFIRILGVNMYNFNKNPIFQFLWKTLIYILACRYWSINSFDALHIKQKHPKTRSTPRAQTSTAPNLRNAKQSSQAWNSLANYLSCLYTDNLMNIHLSVFP